MAHSPFLDLYPTSKISGNKLSEEEIAYYREKEEAKKCICSEDGCTTPLASDNKTGKCSVHGGSKYKQSRTGKYHKGWREDFFRAYGHLKEMGHAVTKESLEVYLVDRSVGKWLVNLRKEELIAVSEKTTVYERTSELLALGEVGLTSEVVKAVDEFTLKGKKRVCMSEVQRRSGLTVANAKLGLRAAVKKGYLTAIEPSSEVILTEKGEQFLAGLS